MDQGRPASRPAIPVSAGGGHQQRFRPEHLPGRRTHRRGNHRGRIRRPGPHAEHDKRHLFRRLFAQNMPLAGSRAIILRYYDKGNTLFIIFPHIDNRLYDLYAWVKGKVEALPAPADRLLATLTLPGQIPYRPAAAIATGDIPEPMPGSQKTMPGEDGGPVAEATAPEDHAFDEPMPGPADAGVPPAIQDDTVTSMPTPDRTPTEDRSPSSSSGTATGSSQVPGVLPGRRGRLRQGPGPSVWARRQPRLKVATRCLATALRYLPPVQGPESLPSQL